MKADLGRALRASLPAEGLRVGERVGLYAAVRSVPFSLRRDLPRLSLAAMRARGQCASIDVGINAAWAYDDLDASGDDAGKSNWGPT
jgi:hypothetical protein